MKKRWVIFCFAVLLAGYPLLIGFWFPRQMQKKLNMIQVPVARHDLDFRHLIQAADLEWRSLPDSFVTEAMILEEDQLIGKVVSNSLRIAEGSIFTSAMLEEPAQVSDRAALMLNPGQAAYSVNADLVQLSGSTLVVNERVDIYCTIQQRDAVPIVDLLLESVRILDLRDRRGLALNDPEGLGVASVIVLAVNQEFIPLLSTALEIGRLQFLVTDQSWKNEVECQLKETSRVLSYLTQEE